MQQPLPQYYAINELQSFGIESSIRKHYPGRNEKYYELLVHAQRKLINTSYRLELTADAIINNSTSSRPTWYSYFTGVEQYYSEILKVVGISMLDAALEDLKQSKDFENWLRKVESIKMEVFLSNFKSLASFFPSLLPLWKDYYESVIDGHTGILQPMLKLSYGRARLFAKRMVNERILHSEKYDKNPGSFFQYAQTEVVLVMDEQNK